MAKCRPAWNKHKMNIYLKIDQQYLCENDGLYYM